MEEATFKGWDNFYLMIGSAGAALIGLLFVVMTLTSGFERAKTLRATTIYMTPTAIHFGVVLASSAVALAPRLPTSLAALLFAISALAGLGNAIWACIGIRAGFPGGEPPHWTDFWFYGALPALMYVVLLGTSLALWLRMDWAPLAAGGCLLVLLLLGIRDAWDLVTWMAPRQKGEAK